MIRHVRFDEFSTRMEVGAHGRLSRWIGVSDLGSWS